MAIYAYYRVSTKTQAEKNSTEMQKAIVRKYCEDNGLTIDCEFSDEGISGAIKMTDDYLRRPGMTRLLSCLKEDDVVIVQNTSRLWRSKAASYVIQRGFLKSKAHIKSVEQPNYDLYNVDPLDELLNTIIEALDFYDKAIIAAKLANGRRTRASNGYKPCGIAPYGYRWDGNEIAVDCNSRTAVIDIFEKYIELKSLQKVKDYCDRKGYKTSQGKSFSKQALKNIIENDFYTGVVTYEGRQTKGEHPVFLGNDLFEQANAILKR